MATGKTRVFRTSSTSKASILLDENSVSLIGNKNNIVIADDRGITIKGPVSFVSDSTERRTGGLFVGLGSFTDMIPSTMVTPLPRVIPAPPAFAVVNIAKDVAFFLSLMV